MNHCPPEVLKDFTFLVTLLIRVLFPSFAGVPPEHRRGVWDGVPGRDQPGVDRTLRPLQHLREFPPPAPHIPQPHGPPQRGRRSALPAQVRK